jgi:hypothetical protein
MALHDYVVAMTMTITSHNYVLIDSEISKHFQRAQLVMTKRRFAEKELKIFFYFNMENF